MVFSIDRKVQSLFHLGLCGKSLKKIGGLQIGFTFVYIFCLKQKTNVLNFKELTPVVFSDLAVNTYGQPRAWFGIPPSTANCFMHHGYMNLKTLQQS